jgi:hypothetical protein
MAVGDAIREGIGLAVVVGAGIAVGGRLALGGG